MVGNEEMMPPAGGVTQVPKTKSNVGENVVEGADREPSSLAWSVVEAMKKDEDLREAFAAMLLETNAFKQEMDSTLDGIVRY